MDLQINMSYARLGIKKADAHIDIKAGQPELELKSTPPRVRIDTRQAEVNIDQEKCFCEVGLKTPDAFTRDMAAKARQNADRATAATARDGDFLAKVNKNPDAIPQLAKYAARKKVDYTIEALPRTRPKINFTGGVDIDWDMGNVELEAKTNRPDISASRASVEVYLIQKPYIGIEYRGKGIDRTI